MEFWVCFYSLLLLITFIAIFNRNYAGGCLIISLILVWIIGAFRLNIGTDYDTYKTFYDTWLLYEGGTLELGEIEPTFYVICTVLNFLNLNSQSLFVVYETLTIAFLYKGLKFYFKDELIILIVIFIYAVYPTNGGHWWDMNGMRQGAAISVSFWATQYLCKDKLMKFICASTLAILFHYSAVFIFLLCLFYKKKISNKLVTVIVFCGFLLNGLGITAKIVIQILGIMANIIGKYEVGVLNAMVGGTLFSPMAFILVVLYYGARKLSKMRSKSMDILVTNGAALYIIIRLYMSFGVEGSIIMAVVHRFETYFLFLYLVLIADAVREFLFQQNSKMISGLLVTIFLFLFGAMGLKTIYETAIDVNNMVNGSVSQGNIDYKFNFDIYD